MQDSIFGTAEFLLPRKDLIPLWPVIACDQFTSEPDYWREAEEKVGSCPSALRLILPEVYLNDGAPERIRGIHLHMKEYLGQGMMEHHPDCFVYVERKLSDGIIRRGLVGVIDLEAYDPSDTSTAKIRATERTVPERIPPRMKVRDGACLELSHVMLLCDDRDDLILTAAGQATQTLPSYETELMLGGGSIRGWVLKGDVLRATLGAVAAYERAVVLRQGTEHPMLYAVGDGNHSLATAKALWEKEKAEAAVPDMRKRYASVELDNLHDTSIAFEPIHRLLTGVSPEKALEDIKGEIGGGVGETIPYVAAGNCGSFQMKDTDALPLARVQDVIDRHLTEWGGKVDYIHGEDSLIALAQRPDALGLLMPPISKNAFFEAILRNGVLPRKTFSIGHARDKRYYLECRQIGN